MVYLKSILAGLAALVLCSLVLPAVVLLVPTIQFKPKITPISSCLFLVHRPAAWVFASVIFAVGFYWEFQKAAKHSH